MKYIELATSKDAHRPNLQSVYRDIDCLVATDGHRLHWINGQEKIEKGFFLNGKDLGEFPEWKAIIPTKTPLSETTIRFSVEDVKRIKAALKLGLVSSSECCGIFTISDNVLTIEIKQHALDVRLSIGTNVTHSGQPAKFNLNLGYFLDAIELPFKESRAAMFNIKVGEKGQAIVIETKLGNALVMPMRD